MTKTRLDLFDNVHKGIRKALCEVCVALGRAGDDLVRLRTAHPQLREALHFIAHHGENEDVLLAPLLLSRAPRLHDAMTQAHRQLEARLHALREREPDPGLYLEACAFASAYFDHMRDEEQLYDPAIRAIVSEDELSVFGRKSVERTAPADARMMLGHMLPAMPRSDAEAFLAKLPALLAEELRPLVA